MTTLRQPRSTSATGFLTLRSGSTVFLVVFCVTCQRAVPSSTNHESSAAEKASAVVEPPVSPAAEPSTTLKPASACAGQYEGSYTVSVTKPGISRKDGAPAQWDSDDGHLLAGPGELTLAVDSRNAVTGSAKGALGQQTLRGSCVENTLRVQLVAMGAESNSIQNAFILADLSGDQATGTLTAATGDGLVRRSGAVTLRKAQ